MKKRNKRKYYNLYAALCTMVTFIMAVVLIVYYIKDSKTVQKTIVYFTIFGLSIIFAVVFTVLFMNDTPNLKNKK